MRTLRAAVGGKTRVPLTLVRQLERMPLTDGRPQQVMGADLAMAAPRCEPPAD